MEKHRIKFDGHDCDYNKQWAEYKIDFAVEEVISELVNTPRFKETITAQIEAQVDTDNLEIELENIKKIIKNKEALISKTNRDITNIDASDSSFENRYQDLTNRLDALYDDLELYQTKRAETEQRILKFREEKIKTESVYKFLLYFDNLYAKFTDVEKKAFLKTFIERVEIFPEEQPDGRLLKAIKFNFPIFYDDKIVDGLSWDKEGHVETVVLLSKGEVDSKKIRVEFSLEDMDMSEFQDGATYPQIKEYVLEHTGLKVSNLYISQIKRKCGIGVGKNYNLPKSEDSRQPQCPQEKEKAIREAFKYFGMI